MVRYVEHELAQERLVLAIMDDVSARPMASCSIPLQSIEPGFFYNLAVPAKTTTEDTVLRVTLCLSASPCHEVSRWRSFGDKSLGPVNVRVAACSADLASMGTTDVSADASDSAAAVVAHFEITTTADSAVEKIDTDARGSIQVYTELQGDATTDDEIISKITPARSMLGPVTLPLVGANSSTDLLWPVSRMALLALPAGAREHGRLLVTLFRCSAAGEAAWLGSSVLQLQNLPEDGDGALVPFSDLPFKGTEGARRTPSSTQASCFGQSMCAHSRGLGHSAHPLRVEIRPRYPTPVELYHHRAGYEKKHSCDAERLFLDFPHAPSVSHAQEVSTTRCGPPNHVAMYHTCFLNCRNSTK